jgi:hypothetical protein
LISKITPGAFGHPEFLLGATVSSQEQNKLAKDIKELAEDQAIRLMDLAADKERHLRGTAYEQNSKMQKLSEGQAVQTEILHRVEANILNLMHRIFGNGDPGLIVRVERLEVVAKWKTTILKLLGGALLGGIFTWLASKL